MTDDIHFEDKRKEIDKLLEKSTKEQKYTVGDRIRFAHEIKENPPEPGFMKVDLKPKIYSIDLNTDAHWWFNHTCTVFPLLLDQAKRTHIDIKTSFKPEKRHADFNLMFIVVVIIGFVGIILFAKMFGLV